MANSVYSPKDTLRKEFKIKVMSGHDPTEADELLGNVIEDYEVYNKELLSLREENSHLVVKLDQLSKAQLTPRVAQEVPKSAAATDSDISKRLSNLEHGIFGKELDEAPSTLVTPSAPSVTAEPANHDVDNTQTCQF